MRKDSRYLHKRSMIIANFCKSFNKSYSELRKSFIVMYDETLFCYQATENKFLNRLQNIVNMEMDSSKTESSRGTLEGDEGDEMCEGQNGEEQSEDSMRDMCSGDQLNEQQYASLEDPLFLDKNVEVTLHSYPVTLEKTLAVIKPEAVKYAAKIELAIQEAGFSIIQKRTVTLTPEQVGEFYQNQYGLLHFPLLVKHMSEKPVIALCLSKENAIQDWKYLMGPADVKLAVKNYPNTLRAKYGSTKDIIMNALHGSESTECAEKEIHFFFPEIILEPMLRHTSSIEFITENVNPTLLDGLTELCKAKPMDPIIWLADWLLMNNPKRARTSENIARVPT